MNTTYIVIAIAFLINLIILIAFKISIVKNYSSKKEISRLEQIRSDINNTLSRINDNEKEFEQKANYKIIEGEKLIKNVETTLDYLFVHQRELSELSEVCQNYSITLNHLKGQTEQAEIRIKHVEDKIGEIKQVEEFINHFQADSEKLSNQLQDMKAEYTHLIATSEQALKNSALSQAEENDVMLKKFKGNLEQFKGTFSEFVETEKNSFAALCREAESVASARLVSINETSLQVGEDIDQGINKLKSFMSELEKSLLELEERKATSIKEISDSTEKSIQDMKSVGEETANILELKLRDREDEINAVFETSTDKLNQKEEEAGRTITVLESKRGAAELAFNQLIDDKKRDIEQCVADLDITKEQFKTKCHEELNSEYITILDTCTESFDQLKGIGEKFIKTVTQKVEDATGAVKSLNHLSEEKISDAVRVLSDYSARLTTAQQNLSAITEQITNHKELLWEKNNEVEKAEDELRKLKINLEDVNKELKETKIRKLDEERALVRLRVQQSSLEKESKQLEEKGSDSNSRKDPSSMIEVLPDDIFESANQGQEQ